MMNKQILDNYEYCIKILEDENNLSRRINILKIR